MLSKRFALLPVLAFGAAAFAFFALGGSGRQPAPVAASMSLPRARALPDTSAGDQYNLRFLAQRLQEDPDDFRSQNRLAGLYLRLLRQSGDHKYIPLALGAARASLRAVPVELNSGALSALALTELANHQFARARDHAMQLAQLDPAKGGAYAIEGDARLELGDVAGAERAWAKMRELGGQSTESETRLARLAVLRGQTDAAQRHFATALALALNEPTPARSTVAWCRWQMGETAFLAGEMAGAERHYRDALTTAPGDVRAQAGLGRVLAAREDWDGAIALLSQAVRATPDPALLATLGDLYARAGREREARAHYELAELSASPAAARTASAREHARLHARHLAMFYADHDRNAAQAYAIATRDYATRRDIYGADALAWTAFKAGDLARAQTALRAALRLQTRDARLFYHAGMIERALGNRDAAKDYLRRALDLNPHFDPLQAPRARHTLEELS